MSTKYEYGIITKNVLLKDLSKSESINTQRTVLLGQIVKVDSILANRNYAIRCLRDGETWESLSYYCSGDAVCSVDEKFWQFLAAVSSPIERVKLAQNSSRCEKLMQITKEMTVGISLTNDVRLGTVMYIGVVKGMGKCIGIKLHEKLPGNRCDGSCAGLQYFSCLPGYGIFTTIEKLTPQYTYNSDETSSKPRSPVTELEASVEKNISHFSNACRDNETNTNGVLSTKNSSYFKTSHSMQNIYDPNSISINTNNEFDQNSVLQPDKMYLLTDSKNISQAKITLNNKNKSELDLKDVIGNMWTDHTDIVPPNAYTHLKKLYDNSETGDVRSSMSDKSGSSMLNNGVVKSPRSKSTNILTHMVNGSKTLPKKLKHNQERVGNKERNTFISTKNIEISPTEDKNSHNRISPGTDQSRCSEICAGRKVPNKAREYENGYSEPIYNNVQDSDIFKIPLFVLELNERNEAVSQQQSAPSTSQKQEITIYYDPEPGTTNDLSIGSLVEVLNDVSEEPMYGVIRWMGVEAKAKFVLVGIELEEEQSHLPLTLTDGTHNGQKFFECANHRALFVPISQCHRDSRFLDGVPTPVHSITEKTFGKECPVIYGSIAPLIMPTEEDVEAVCGKFRGIQGHHNSCYLDATLFAMFTYTGVFDSLLYRPKGPNDIPHYEEVQRVLREEIVNPLRSNLFVRADRVMNLRKLLDQLSSVSGLTSEEKDPEEFLNSLLAQILKAEPFLKLSSGQEAYYYQLFVEKDDDLELPTVQQLFEQSFLTSDIKLKEVPSCLIIQMPRFGKSYKMYPRILPSQLLDVTDVIENSPRQCTVCGRLATWECRQCFGECGVGLESTAFCAPCLETAHSHNRRSGHCPRRLNVCHDFSIMAEHCPPPRLYMELFAVVCIETSHYVAFVKCGVGHEAPWCFFDSMADRKGERNGYNIPEMVACPDVSKWLSDEQICRHLHENSPHDRHLPEHARRLLCDAYICMYQSPDVMMYR